MIYTITAASRSSAKFTRVYISFRVVSIFPNTWQILREYKRKKKRYTQRKEESRRNEAERARARVTYVALLTKWDNATVCDKLGATHACVRP